MPPESLGTVPLVGRRWGATMLSLVPSTESSSWTRGLVPFPTILPVLRIGTVDVGTLSCVTQPTVVEYVHMWLPGHWRHCLFLALMFTYLCCPCVRMDSNKAHVFNSKTMKTRTRPTALESVSAATRTIPENRHSPCIYFFVDRVHISVLPLR